MTVRKHEIWGIHTLGGSVSFYQTTITNIVAIFRSKPKNFDVTTEDWVLMVVAWGIPRALAKCFMQWQRDTRKADTRPSAAFGQASDVCCTISGLSMQKYDQAVYARFVDEMLATDWALEELGDFGEWFKEAGLPEPLIAPVIEGYLRS